MTGKKDNTIAVVGLGYAGLPVLLAFEKHFPAIGFDISEAALARVREKHPGLKATLTADAKALAEASAIFVLVPTPVDANNQPDLSCLRQACAQIGGAMQPGTVVVFESTVYPGATEEFCIPLLERTSGLKWKKDFFVAYSPERINPGDTKHNFTNVVKLVAGDTEETAARVQALYASVMTAETHRAPSIRVAEAAKILENVQRDVNIALVNEFALLMDALNIDNRAVLKAAATKWNFLPFTPGLPGGHCIGVDSYYLMHKAHEAGFPPSLIAASRDVNERMAAAIAHRAMAHMKTPGQVNVFGLSFKENIDDIRHSAAPVLIAPLQAAGNQVAVHDPLADAAAAKASYGIALSAWEAMPVADVIIIAVAHDTYKSQLDYFAQKLAHGGLIIDVKAILNKTACEAKGLSLWQL